MSLALSHLPKPASAGPSGPTLDAPCTEATFFDPLDALYDCRHDAHGGAAPVRLLLASCACEPLREIIRALGRDAGVDVVAETGAISVCLTRLQIDRPDAVLVGAELADGSGAELAGLIADSAPQTPVFLQLNGQETHETWSRIVRSGVRDVFTTPPDPEQFLDQLRNATRSRSTTGRAASRAEPEPAPDSCRIITFTSPCRGVGQTTLATNTAICLAEIAPTVLIDLRLPLGDAAALVNVMPRHTIAHFARSRGSIDSAVVNAVMEETSYGIKLIAAPLSPPGERVDLQPPDVERLLQVVGAQSHFMVVDAPPPDHPFTSVLFEHSERIFVTGRADVLRLRSVKAFLRSAQELPALRERLQPAIVLGRERRECKPHALPELCGHPAPWILPFDDRAATRAINLGRPVCAPGERGALATAIRKQCRSLARTAAGR